MYLERESTDQLRRASCGVGDGNSQIGKMVTHLENGEIHEKTNLWNKGVCLPELMNI